MNFTEITALYDEYICGTYSRFPLAVERGKGARCTDVNGKEYIDFSAGIGVNSLGFSSDAWVEAVTGQAQKLNHVSNLYYTEPQALLAKKLCDKSGMKKVFFCNSGAEANEGAIKAARKYGIDRKGAQAYEIITLDKSFHGRTFGALSATAQPVFQEPFGPMLPGFVYTAPNDISDLKAKVSANTCAIMLESVQGESGVLNLNEAYLQAVAEICGEQDILLILDEVQTGIGRTGKFFSYMHFGLTPDIVSAAKGIGGGLPLGAVLFGEKAKDVLGPGTHGTTYGGNPIVCAGSLAVLEQMTDGFMLEVAEKGAAIAEQVSTMPHVTGVSGLGMMLGISVEGIDAPTVVSHCLEKGLIVLTAKEKVRFLPPLTITMEEIKTGLDIFESVLKEV